MATDRGYLLIGAGRPDEPLQRQVLARAGLDTKAYGPVWLDHLPRRASRPQLALISRNYLINETGSGDLVHVPAVLCLGMSDRDAEWFIRALHEKGSAVVLHDLGRTFEPGADLSEIGPLFRRRIGAFRARRWRENRRLEAEAHDGK